MKIETSFRNMINHKFIKSCYLFITLMNVINIQGYYREIRTERNYQCVVKLDNKLDGSGVDRNEQLM